jgi:hypothetical protein
MQEAAEVRNVNDTTIVQMCAVGYWIQRARNEEDDYWK